MSKFELNVDYFDHITRTPSHLSQHHRVTIILPQVVDDMCLLGSYHRVRERVPLSPAVYRVLATNRVGLGTWGMEGRLIARCILLLHPPHPSTPSTPRLLSNLSSAHRSSSLSTSLDIGLFALKLLRQFGFWQNESQQKSLSQRIFGFWQNDPCRRSHSVGEYNGL